MQYTRSRGSSVLSARANFQALISTTRQVFWYQKATSQFEVAFDNLYLIIAISTSLAFITTSICLHLLCVTYRERGSDRLKPTVASARVHGAANAG